MTMPPLHLHIGAPKTGTTYLQSLMREQRKQLRSVGMLIPGANGRQKQASRAFIREGGRSRGASGGGPWSELVAEVQAWPGPAVISNESFGTHLSDDHLAKLTKDFAGRDLHIIFTVRDLQRQLPAAWQEAVKNGSTLSFAEYADLVSSAYSGVERSVDVLRHGIRRLAEVLESAPAVEDQYRARRVWWAQDAPKVLARWSERVKPQHIHVVTVPQRGAPRDLLWQRFANVLGIDPAVVDAAVVQPNVSLGNVEANVLRRLNAAVMAGPNSLQGGEYIRFVKTPVANGVLQFPGSRGRIHLTTEQAQWAAAESARIADELSTLEYDLVGDLDELRPPAAPVEVEYEDPDQPTAEDERDAAIATLAGLIQRMAESSRQGK